MKKLTKIIFASALALSFAPLGALLNLGSYNHAQPVYASGSSVSLNNLYYYDNYGEHAFSSGIPTGYSFEDGVLTISGGATPYGIETKAAGSLTVVFEGDYGDGIAEFYVSDGELTLTSNSSVDVTLSSVGCDGALGFLTIKGGVNLNVVGTSNGIVGPLICGSDSIFVKENASLISIDPNLNGRSKQNMYHVEEILKTKFLLLGTTGAFKVGLYNTLSSTDMVHAITVEEEVRFNECGGGFELYKNSSSVEFINYQGPDSYDISDEFVTELDTSGSKYKMTVSYATISYNSNGGSGTMDNSYCTKGNYNLRSCSFVAPTDKQFKCWAENSPSGTQYNAGATYNVTGHVAFYAIWEDAPTEYIVNYSAGEGQGSGNLDYVVAGTQITLQSPENVNCLPLDGKEFDAWSIGGNRYNPGDLYTVNADTYITALWKDIPVEALTGTVTIIGTLKYGETLTASVTGSNNTGTLSYQWKRNDANIAYATSQTYTLTQEDIGTTLKVVVTSSIETGSIVSAATSTINKADGPAAPTGLVATECTTSDNNDGTISGITALMEYKLSSESLWTNGTGEIVTGLVEGTYNVRVKETATHKAGEIANVVVNGYDAPTLYSITVNNGEASAVSSEEGETITVTANTAPDGYIFAGWTSEDVTFADASSASTTFVMPAHNVTVTATFEEVIPDPVTLSSITLSGTQKTAFEVGDSFTYEGLVVTAHYSDETSHTVTGYTVSTPDMSTAGNKTITVTYTENEATKTATYQITVSEKELPPEPPVDPDTPETPSKSGLPVGAVVGIIIGSTIVVGIGGFALVWFVIKKKTWADFVALFKKK